MNLKGILQLLFLCAALGTLAGCSTSKGHKKVSDLPRVVGSCPTPTLTTMAKETHTYAVIMAGGIGSRFWPMSRSAEPKQFLDILGTGRSLIRMTFDRLEKLVPADHILVVTNARYKDQVAAHLPSMPVENILCEPFMRNTAPCIAYANAVIASRDPQASVVVAPSDHLILDESGFLEVCRTALGHHPKHHEFGDLGHPAHPS